MNYTLYSTPAAFGIANASPFCLKVETLLNLADLDYTRVTASPTSGPRGKVPFVRCPEGTLVADSRNIVEHLQTHHAIAFPQGPHHRLVLRLVEEHLYWIQVHFRWAHHAPAVREAFFGGVPWPVRELVFTLVARQVRQALHGQGTGRRPEIEMLTLAGEDFDALELALGSGPFFDGEAPGVADASVYGLLTQLRGELRDELTATLDARSTLVAYHERMKRWVAGSKPARAA